jgi:TATA-box binding protein (TBP) (component of TFIID and TFIIIB)
MPELKVSKTTICTGICSGNLKINLDLDIFFQKVKITSELLGAKYHGKIKGNIKGDKSFFNQITFCVYPREIQKEVNVKLFANGNLHFSGVKDESQAKASIRVILDQLVSVKGIQTFKTVTIDGIIYDKEDYNEYNSTAKTKKNRFEIMKIYSYPDEVTGLSRKIGIKRLAEFVINGEPCVLEDDHFVSVKFIDFVKKIYNKSGDEIGFYTYIHKYKRKNILLKNRNITKISDDLWSITDRYDCELATIEKTLYDTEQPQKTLDLNSSKVTIEYSAVPKDCSKVPSELIKGAGISVVNLNSKFTINYDSKTFDKKKLKNLFSEKYNLASYYNYEGKYQGVALKLFYDENNNLVRNGYSNTRKVSVTFFSSGTVLISGTKTKQEIVVTKTDIINMISQNTKEILEETPISVDIIDPELTIWQLI